MAKTKKELTALEKVMKEFNDDLNDTELQERYDRFVKNLEETKARYNEHIPEVNQKMKMSQDLAQMIIDSAMMGFLNNDAIAKAKEVSAYLDGIRPQLDSLKEGIESQKELINKYKQKTEDKLFNYWKVIKALEPTEPWIDWKRKYENRIF